MVGVVKGASVSGVLDKGAANPRADFKRLKDGLADRGAAREWNGLMWPVQTQGG